MPRKHQDTPICRLCRVDEASSQESHIVPKTMVRRLFIKGKPVKLHSFKVNEPSTNIIAQDVAKEKYLLCSVCEAYFSALETYFSNKIHHPIVVRNDRDLYWDLESGTDTGKGYMVSFNIAKYCHEANSVMVQLLIDSILFRIHIASGFVWGVVTFPEVEAERFRANLMEFRTSKILELLAMCGVKSPKITNTNYILFCPDKKIEGGFIGVENFEVEGNYIKFLLGEYQLLLDGDLVAENVHFLNNASKEGVFVVPMPEMYYRDIYERVAEKLRNPQNYKQEL